MFKCKIVKLYQLSSVFYIFVSLNCACLILRIAKDHILPTKTILDTFEHCIADDFCCNFNTQ